MGDTQKGSRDRRKLIEQYWAYMGAGEFSKAGACMAADTAVWFPNTREVFRGRDAFVAFNQKYPGKWSIEIVKGCCGGYRHHGGAGGIPWRGNGLLRRIVFCGQGWADPRDYGILGGKQRAPRVADRLPLCREILKKRLTGAFLM
jgi:hypothetical protein